jgi:uncharacterized protein YodC (DUF2158 family)
MRKIMTKNNVLEFYNIGTQVKLEKDIQGTIISVTIRPNNAISYTCGWWNGRSYCTETFIQEQIEALVTTEKTRIGFV